LEENIGVISLSVLHEAPFVCGDYLVVPAGLIRDTVQGGIYIVLERGFHKARVVHITSPYRLLGALQKREVLVGL
jgi:hypothetical protein